MKVAVIGIGHVGLVTGACLAAVGHHVVGYDIDDEKVEKLRIGLLPFYEPGLEELLAKGIYEGRLSFSSRIDEAVAEAEVVFICVGTPARANGEANLVAVEGAARELVRHAQAGTIVVEKSTVPAGTAARVQRTLERERPDIARDLHVVSNPEFLREGQAIEDSMHPERIIVGAGSDYAFAVMRTLYSPLLADGCRLIETDVATAELAKHACNAFLALKISYANALARICELAGADVVAVTEVMGSDQRIGKAFLQAGLGYGGYCFPKDLVAFQRLAASLGYEFKLLSEVAAINEEAVSSVVGKVREALWNIDEKRVVLLGLSYKPDTDDVRFSPALTLARRLLDEGADVIGYDPQAGVNAKDALPELEVALDAYDAIRDAHCVVLCTEWDEFRSLDLEFVRDILAYPIVIDGRNLFGPKEMAEAGLVHHQVGRPFAPAARERQYA